MDADFVKLAVTLSLALSTIKDGGTVVTHSCNQIASQGIFIQKPKSLSLCVPKFQALGYIQVTFSFACLGSQYMCYA